MSNSPHMLHMLSQTPNAHGILRHVIMKEMLYEVRCLKSNEDMIIARIMLSTV